MRRYLLLILSLCVIWIAKAQTGLEYRYWFDNNDKQPHTGIATQPAWNMNLDVSDLDGSLHSLYIQVADSSGNWSSPMSSHFLKMPVKTESVCKYWFDNDIANLHELSTINGMATIDVAILPEGIHLIHAGVYAPNGDILSSIVTSMIVKMPNYQSEENGYFDCLFYIDSKLHKQERISANAGIASWSLDATNIPHGIHQLQVMIVTPNGAISDLKSSFFYRAMTNAEKQTVKLIYTIDDSEHYSTAGQIDNNTYHFDLDLAEISDGLHRISYMLMSDDGTTTKVMSQLFLKTPLGGNGIKSYSYWVNEDIGSLYHKELETPQQSVNLIELLDLPHYPIKSSSFHFAVEDNIPTIYPKNFLNVAFFDASNHALYHSEDYVDVTMPTQLNPDDFVTLESNKRKTVDNLGDNEIAWFKFTGEEGEIVSIKANNSCTIDLFAPNGDLISKKDGYNSTAHEDVFLDYDGIYYVAIHDVKSKSKDINVDFYQIAKYAIIEYDVHTVGNGGLSTITFKGNGYFSLNAIKLTNGSNNVECVDIKRLTNTQLEATFEFGGIPTGNYDLEFEFIDETLAISNAINVVEATNITLSDKFSYEPIHLIGREASFDISISNHGNNTAYKVPVYLYVETKLSQNQPKINLTGLDVEPFWGDLELEQFTLEQNSKLNKLASEIGDNLNFIKIKGISPETGDSILVNSCYFLVDIPPMQTKEFSVNVMGQDAIKCYTVIPNKWVTYSQNQNIPHHYRINNDKAKSIAKDYFCCYHDRVECVLNVATNTADYTSMISALCGGAGIAATADITSCVTSSLSSISSNTSGIFCSENASWEEKSLYEKLSSVSEGISIAGFVKDCFLRYVAKIKNIEESFKLLNNLNKLNNFSFGHVSSNINCISAFFSKKPDCPPKPPKGGESVPVASLDPNDILGYVAQSGSHYVGIDQERLPYTIEFENDSTLATSSALTISLKDKLNTSIFDVNSIHTSKVVIGNKEVNIDKHGEFITTVDMRPEINALAEVKLTINPSGEIKYNFTTLDPMTVEPSEDILAGILPINNQSKDGEGYVSFDVKLLDNINDGTIIDNSASIVFDLNEAIETPVWSNETDYVRPVSYVSDIEIVDESNINIILEGLDERSGIWKYDLYYQPGVGSDWFLLEENMTRKFYPLNVYEDMDYGFCVIATDMAGNREVKELSREFSYMNGQISSSVEKITIDNISNENNIYDLLGRKVFGKPSPGLYILNGKKTLIR